MDTRFLQSFVAVVESGSIAEAARRLDVATTTVAQQIRALEDDIGAKLLTRAGRTVKPTVVGARILERSRDLLRDVRDLRSAASDTGLPAGPLRLGATPSALMGLLPPFLRRWMQAHPQIPIYIEPGTSAVLLDRVMSGELDAAIVVHPAFELPKTCAWRLLREEPLILLTQARLQVKDALATAAHEPFIRYDRRVVAGKMADEYLRKHGVRPKVQFELDGIEHIARLVAEGFGVSVLPDWPIIGPADPQLRRWKLPEPSPVRRVGMVWLRTSVRSPLVEAFVQIACSESPKARKQK
ncbi:LysR family transcriptional regulator [Paraburkholderia sp. Ac-20336]|uniref:LysR family transcriptional regulator n=1 Tax=unclassified Paraburkholderia TaxID=2615204 RepID=UPI00142015BA|nr:MULTISPECIES: LysR family transcriptional regulator [unclassified Paraburkholderia]MBN3802842.1 LysR family transcriptional regulator [Paraburkholderia sp. Ac-20336]MBN3847550.1 LysR family transcriptional regulator [Paraburkholderia sp. Ac-20342]NIF79588.1 LysR family transcriptional regulator [Paraburkholderia sp. Cy-641]